MPEKDDPADGEAVERKLHGHGRIDRADAAEEEHDLAALEPARDELHAVHGLRGGVLELRPQHGHLRREGRDDGRQPIFAAGRMRGRRPEPGSQNQGEHPQSAQER